MALLRQGGRYDYEYKEYILDSEDQLKDINTKHCCPGSTAFITSTSQAFILCESGEWKEI